MATYKVIQDIEAEDKLVGPLTLRQFIYAGIAAICLYLSFLAVTKHAIFLIAFFLPIAGMSGFFAFPWGRDQPTEVWALAKIRFLIKPRRRIWDQSGVKEMVTITVPKQIERIFTDGLSQNEVHSRLHALADTIDSRGWAIKNVNVNLSAQGTTMMTEVSDRLIGPSSLPQEVTDVDINASDDILDEQANPVAHNFDTMIARQSQTHRQQLMQQLQAPDPATVVPQQPVIAQPMPNVLNTMGLANNNDLNVATIAREAQLQQPQVPNNYWFLNQPAAVPGQATFVDAPVVIPGSPDSVPPAAPIAADPTAEEAALVDKFKAANQSMAAAYGHMKVVQPLSAQTPQNVAPPAPPQPAPQPVVPKVTALPDAVTMGLANNNDLNVATIAREAHKQRGEENDEVVISLR